MSLKEASKRLCARSMKQYCNFLTVSDLVLSNTSVFFFSHLSAPCRFCSFMVQSHGQQQAVGLLCTAREGQGAGERAISRSGPRPGPRQRPRTDQRQRAGPRSQPDSKRVQQVSATPSACCNSAPNCVHVTWHISALKVSFQLYPPKKQRVWPPSLPPFQLETIIDFLNRKHKCQSYSVRPNWLQCSTD